MLNYYNLERAICQQEFLNFLFWMTFSLAHRVRFCYNTK
ncbi:hypothetical protein [Oscillospiraceae bacterium]|nr:hypothetical protein [Oscillospiraceae bacterium]